MQPAIPVARESEMKTLLAALTALKKGDSSVRLPMEWTGLSGKVAEAFNEVVELNQRMTEELTRLSQTVGKEGRLRQRGSLGDVRGFWKASMGCVNALIDDLVHPTSETARVIGAVAQGDLSQTMALEIDDRPLEGEFLRTARTINKMVNQLGSFASEVTRVAREAGTEGKLGGQAQVEGVSGTWKDLTDSVNFMASNLTAQVRNIADVTTAVAKGDLSKKITVDVKGEIAALADTINSMIDTLATFADQVTSVAREVGVEGKLGGQAKVPGASGTWKGLTENVNQLAANLTTQVRAIAEVATAVTQGVLELASFEGFSNTHQAFLEQLMESIGIVINTIEANMRTEDLLKQSQSLAHELQSRQEELQKTNQELQEKARLLAHQNEEVERKNAEVEQARQALEEKARQLALTSKYKSEFLANMSHELRTPLNSLLILSDQLCANPAGNLTVKQVEFAKTIHSSGNDLLMLINDILDLSKIESGTVVVDIGEVQFDELQRYVERNFRHVAESKQLNFMVRLDPRLATSMFTDAKRLQQIIKNLLSNAFKFTHYGQVTLAIEPAHGGWSSDNEDLNRAPEVVAFSVSDTGIGISPDKQQIIFEAFQQADGSTSRKYGGTGLGLAISRELARLLQGEIRLESRPNKGSTFTLFLPRTATARAVRCGLAQDPATIAQNAIQTAKYTSSREVSSASHAKVQPGVPAVATAEPEPPVLVNEADDDRDTITPDDQVLLIVENDLGFARFLLDTARERGYKGLVTSLGAAALALAQDYKLAAILLDIFLPDIEGWRVLERLKNDLNSRHIPVCVISTEEARDRALTAGALRFVPKPVRSKTVLDNLLCELKQYTSRTVKNVLLFQRDESGLQDIEHYVNGASDVRVTAVQDAPNAIRALREQQIDCIVLDPDAAESGAEALTLEVESKGADAPLPIVLYSQNGELARDDARWQRLARTGRVHWVHSAERLLDQTTLLLHRRTALLPQNQRVVLENMYDSNKSLAEKKVLIVDDDVRNIFALSSVLEEYNMEIYTADNGKDAIRFLQNGNSVDIVLMDIMMPEIDGLDTTREIRRIPSCKGVPIIAVTAKAMKGDRDRCLEADAWDYLSKPVDREQLLAALRLWLQR